MCSFFKAFALLALFSSSLALPLGAILGGEGNGGVLGGVLGGDGGLGGLLGQDGPLGLLGGLLNTQALQDLLKAVFANLDSVLTQLLAALQDPTGAPEAIQTIIDENPIELATIINLLKMVLTDLLNSILNGGIGGGVTGLPVTLPVTVPTPAVPVPV